MSAPIRLYWNKICPFVQRAWIAAIEKNVTLELIEVPLGGETPEWYKKINPRETVPTLQHGDTLIFESNLIAQYLDDQFEPKQSLFPGSAYDRHRVRFFIEQVGEFVGYAYDFLMTGPLAEGAAEKLADFEWNVKNIEKLLIEQSPRGPFFLGETFSLADIALVPFLDRFRYTLAAYCNGYDLFASAPRTKALLDAAFLRPSVFQTSQSAAFYIDAYKSYGKLEETPRPFKLYSNPLCPFAERTRIAAALKKVAVEIIDIDLQNKPEWYEKDVNPRGTVPALVIPGGSVVHESNLIVSYFDEEFPNQGPQLVPTGALQRYQLNFFLDNLGGFTSAVYGFLLSKGAEDKREALKSAAAVAEGLLVEQSPGPFFFGAEPSLADIAVIPHLVRLGSSLVELGGGYTTFFADFPRLGALDAAARAHPVIGQVLQEPVSYLETMRQRVKSDS